MALSQLQQAYGDLAKILKIDVAVGTLKKEDRLHSFLIAAKWPFSKTDVYSILERVSRLQQYVNAILLADQATALERMSIQHAETARSTAKAEITRRLSPLKMLEVQHTTLSPVPEGSAAWFLQSEKFVSWKAGLRHPSMLWCTGIPGAGKTVIASVVTDHLRKERSQQDETGSAVACVFLKHDDQEQSKLNILGCILSQLVSRKAHVPAELEALYHLAGTPPTPFCIGVYCISRKCIHPSTRGITTFYVQQAASLQCPFSLGLATVHRRSNLPLYACWPEYHFSRLRVQSSVLLLH